MQIDKTTCLNGALWRSDNLAGADAGCSVVEKFLEEHPHSGWGLSIYNTLDGSTAEIECEVENIPTDGLKIATPPFQFSDFF